MRRSILSVSIVLVAVLVGIQLVPYGRVRACFDCHSNETVWPWYSSVAPLSWLVQRDVDEGRRELNFSEWHRPQREARESADAVRTGEMPPWFYALGVRSARLTDAEQSALVAGLAATLGTRRREKDRDR